MVFSLTLESRRLLVHILRPTFPLSMKDFEDGKETRLKPKPNGSDLELYLCCCRIEAGSNRSRNGSVWVKSGKQKKG
jgi:hypothetical protein